MSMDTRSTADLIRIAVAGGGFALNGAARSTADLVRIAVAASSKQAPLKFTGMNTKTVDELVRIAVAAKGCVTFEG